MFNESQSTIHISNLPVTVTEQFLQDYFQQFGTIVKITLDQKSPSQPKFAFIVYSTPEEADNAIRSANYYQIDGSTITVNLYHPNFRQIQKSNANVVIENVDESITQQDLHNTFESFGPIISCKIPTTLNGKSRNIAYIQFTNSADAQNAIQQLKGASLNGRAIKLHFYDPTENSLALKVSKIPPAIFDKNQLNNWLGDQIGKSNAGLLMNLTQTILLKLPENDEYREGIFIFIDSDSCQDVYNLLSANQQINVQKITKQEKERLCTRNSDMWNQFKIKQSVEKCIYVKNILPTTSENDLRKVFSRYAHVENIKIKKNPQGVAATITLANHEEVKNAIKHSIFIVSVQEDGTYLQMYVDPYIPHSQKFMISPSERKMFADSQVYLDQKIKENGDSPSLHQRKSQLSKYQILDMYYDDDLLQKWIDSDHQMNNDED